MTVPSNSPKNGCTMKCDHIGCNAWQWELHQQIGNPVTYYCCRCNGCDSSCHADGSNTKGDDRRE